MPPRLVAVSKGQPVDLVQEAYSYGLRHFGENYVSVHAITLVSIFMAQLSCLIGPRATK